MADLRSSRDFAAICIKNNPRRKKKYAASKQAHCTFTTYVSTQTPCQTDVVFTEPAGSLSTATTRNLKHKHPDKVELSN